MGCEIWDVRWPRASFGFPHPISHISHPVSHISSAVDRTNRCPSPVHSVGGAREMPVETAEQVWGRATPLAAVEDREEAEWIDRARAGEEAAFRWLLGRYRQRVV